jgi:hypothetical protein
MRLRKKCIRRRRIKDDVVMSGINSGRTLLIIFQSSGLGLQGTHTEEQMWQKKPNRLGLLKNQT